LTRHVHVVGGSPRHVYIIGAGMAGLAAALSLVAAGVQVTMHEAGPQAGGRCRSYFDRALGCRIDNGNHLLLSGNHATFAFLDQIGARATLTGPDTPLFPFMDVATGDRWTLRPNVGRVPWWMLVPGRRVPGMRLRDALPALALHKARPEQTVTDILKPGVLYRRLLEPLAIAALNTPPAEGSARLLGAVVQETLAAGGGACIPAFPREGLSESFVDPAIAWLAARGATIRTGSRIGALRTLGDRAVGLDDASVGAGDAIILAVPAPVATALVPGLDAPDRFQAILNVHYRIDADPGPAGFFGIVGGTAEWIFVKPGVVSVTISAANGAVDTPPDALAQQVWTDVRAALQLDHPIPTYRVIKEKRATFAATPAQEARRPGNRTVLKNVFLAGDWTATGLPATIEGAIRSGRAAAAAFL
jgi:squalene-associated FAD-dependent desaturase